MCHPLDSVVIRYLYVVGIAFPPHEAHAELVVDGNTVLAFPVMAQLFQPALARSFAKAGLFVQHSGNAEKEVVSHSSPDLRIVPAGEGPAPPRTGFADG